MFYCQQEFLVESITIQLGDALTPQKVSILRSLDGRIFTPWIYAVSNLDLCSQFFNASIKSLPTALTDTICVGYTANDQPPGDVVSIVNFELFGYKLCVNTSRATWQSA